MDVVGGKIGWIGVEERGGKTNFFVMYKWYLRHKHGQGEKQGGLKATNEGHLHHGHRRKTSRYLDINSMKKT